MTGPLILHIETTTDICSVSISDKDQLLSIAESGPERSHAVLLNRYIRKVCADSGKELKDLDAVSVSKGPGSYTGLRIGVSTAKGLAYALEIPIIATGTLDHMAVGAGKNPEINKIIHQYGDQVLLCPMLDARRMEVYSAIYTTDGTMIDKVTAVIVDKDSYNEFLHKHHLCFFGNGAEKCKPVLDHPHAHFIKGIHPSSAHMVIPGLIRYQKQEFEDVAYFEPFYLKEFLATNPRKKT